MNTAMSDYNMEQQGDLVAHYFSAAYLHALYVDELPFLSRVLAKFIESPSDATLLPK